MASKNGDGGEVKNAREAVVSLGGKEFMISSLNMRGSREWRQEFSKPVQQVLGMLNQMQGVELSDVSSAAGVLQQVGTFLLGSVDVLVEAMFAYSPVLAAEREWIEDHADDTEAMAALWEVLKLAYPFGGLVSMVNRGRESIGT